VRGGCGFLRKTDSLLYLEIDNKSLNIILKELEKHKKLFAVGAFPIAKKYQGFSLWKKLLDNVLNILSRHHPMSEISK